MSDDLDLFGNAIRAGRGRAGRPPFTPTTRDRNKVRLLLALGWSNPRIAHAVEVSLPTLHKHFRVELTERAAMRDRLDARLLELAFTAAASGNVGGLKVLGQMIERSDRVLVEATIDNAQAEPAPRRIGKREAAEAEARAVGEGEGGDEWGGDLDFTGGPRPH